MSHIQQFSCAKDTVFEAQRKELVDNINSKGWTDFNFVNKAGIDNMAKLLTYTIQQAKCSEAYKSNTIIKQRVFETLKIIFIIMIVWKFIALIVYKIDNKIDMRSSSNKVINILEGLISVLIALSLIYKFDSTFKFLEHINVGTLMLLIVSATILGIIYILLTRKDTKYSWIIATVFIIVIVGIYGFINTRMSSEATKRDVASSVHNFAKRNKTEILKWKPTLPNFTDTVFISISAWMLLLSSVKDIF